MFEESHFRRLVMNLVASVVVIGMGSTGQGAAQDRRHAGWLERSEGLGRDPNVVLHFDFEQGEGDVLVNKASGSGAGGHHAEKLSGKINDCAWVEGRWPGKGALRFDGQGYVEFPNTSVMKELYQSRGTMEMWLKPDSDWNDANSRFLFDPAGYPQWALYKNGDGDRISFFVGTSATSPLPGWRWQLAKWYHIAITWENVGSGKADGRIRIYVNGKFYPHYSDGKNLKLPRLRSHTRVGRGYGGTGVNGVIDEVAVYDKVLSPQEIKQHYKVGAPRPDTSVQPVRYEAWTDYAYDPVFPESVKQAKHSEISTVKEEGTDSWARNLTGVISVRGAAGELVPVAIHIRNQGTDRLPIRLHFQNVTHQEDAAFTLNAERIDMHLVDFVMTQTKDIVPDPLPRAAGANNVQIAPNETRSFFATIDTRGLPAGLWKGSIQITPLRTGPILGIPFEIRVAPVVLPEEMPIWVTVWTYPLRGPSESAGRGSYEAYVNLTERVGFNCLLTRSHAFPLPKLAGNGDLVGINTLDLDQMLVNRKFDRKKHFLVIGLLLEHTSYHWSPEGGKLLGEQWSRNFVKYVRMLAKHVRENLDIPYERWALYLQDERINEGEGFPAFGRLTRQADPKVRIWANAVQELAVVKKAEPYIDIFVPNVDHIPNYPDSVKFMRDKGKEFWIYDNAGAQPPNKTAVPRNDPNASHRDLRMHGWHAWDLDLKGVSYWLFIGKWWSHYSGFSESQRGNYTNCSFIYLGHDGPVTSRRLEAYREGLEDYKLLWVIDRAAKAQGQDPDMVQEVRAHVKAAVKQVLAKPRKAEKFVRWRNILLDDAAKLCAAAPLEVKMREVRTTRQSATLKLAASKPVRVWVWHRGEGVSSRMAERKWILAASSLEADTTPIITIRELVPGQAGEVMLVIAGPEGQQRLLSQDFTTKGW